MKQLHWNRVLKTPAKQTIWDDVEEAPLDLSMVTRFAAKVVEKKDPAEAKGGAASKKDAGPKVVSVLDQKRSSAIGIMLSRLPAPAVIREGIRTLDSGKIERDHLESIIANLPTPEEIQAVKDAAGPNVALDKPEKYVLMLATMERLGPRLRSWAFKLDYDLMIDNLRGDVKAITAACKELSQSKHLKRVLGTVLAFGNYMNGGTAKGQADGFTVDFLTKLTDTKDLENKVTLLDQIIEYLAAKFPETLVLPEELAGCKAASKVQLERLEGEIAKLAQRHKATRSLSDNVVSSPTAEPGDPFNKLIPPFLDESEASIKALSESFAAVQELFYKTVAFFGVPEGKAKSTKTEEYFGIFKTFLIQFETALPKKTQTRARGESQSNTKAANRKSLHPAGANKPGGMGMADLVNALKAGGGIGPGMLKKRQQQQQQQGPEPPAAEEEKK